MEFDVYVDKVIEEKKIGEEEELDLCSYLENSGIWCDAYVDRSELFDTFKVYINWGDWKHEHWRCDYLMEQKGFRCVDVIVTEENGSDCYCGEHWYERRLS